VEDIQIFHEHKLKTVNTQNWTPNLEKLYSNGKPVIPNSHTWWTTAAMEFTASALPQSHHIMLI
jgi:hypothetical protein